MFTSNRKRPAATASDLRAFTLVELVLVMAIVVVVASLAAAYFTRSYSGQHLKKGADRVRAEFGKCRVRAMRTGNVQAFYYVPGGNQFTIGEYADMASTSIPDANQARSPGGGQYQFFDDLLPRGVYFAGADVAIDSRAQWETELAGGGSGDLRAILFYGDGTAQNAKLTLAHENGLSVQITLRGLTGMASVSPVTSSSNIANQ